MKRLLIFAFFLLLTTPGFAQKTYAVVLGVADYVGTKNDLHYSDDDARAITRFLRSPAGGRVPAHQIITLTNSQVTHPNVLRAFRLFAQAQPNDRIIFYFSGHGLEGSFFTHTGQPLLHSELKTAFRRSAAKTKIVWADACRSGSMKRPATARRTSQQTYQQLNDPSLNIIVMASSRSSQNSIEFDKLRQGAFTFYLIKGAQGEADRNQNRVVTVKEHFDYVYKEVRHYTRNSQIPIIYGHFSNTTPVTVL